MEAAILRTRRNIARAEADRRGLQLAPPPLAELKEQATALVSRMADAGRPRINRGGFAYSHGHLTVDWRVAHQNIEGATPIEVANLLAWLEPDRMTAAVHAEIDAAMGNADASAAVPTAERAKRLAVLQTQLLNLEREEEALIEIALASGVRVTRRVTADPLAILGVAYDDKFRAKKPQGAAA